MRLHTDETLNILDVVTNDLGNRIREFSSATCPNFTTKELPREARTRLRRQAQRSQGKSLQEIASNSQTRQLKALNLQTYKFHALADYPAQIRTYGTTDSYSTQAVCAPSYLCE